MRSIGRTLQLLGVLLYACAELVVKRPATRMGRAVWLHQLCRRALVRFGVEVRVRGEFPKCGVLISNHLSYVDIVVFAAMSPCVFVAKAEMERWPLLGWMTTMAGTVYVRRGRGGSAKKAGGEMRTAAEAGLPVVFFPEGTTSDGEQILKFHSGLLAEALAGEQPVRAAYLQYFLTEGNGGFTVKDDVAYWGERSMLAHMFRFLSLRGVRAEVVVAEEPIRFTGGAGSRKLIAVEARQAMCALSEACVGADEPVGTAG